MVDPFAVRVEGPLSPYAHDFATEMVRMGYSRRTARDHVYAMAWLSCWLAREGFSAGQLTDEVVDRFVLARRAAGHRRWCTHRSLRPMLSFLRGVHAIAPEQGRGSATGLEALLADYRRYLVVERRLAPSSVTARLAVARRFMASHERGGMPAPQELRPSDVTEFVLAASGRYRPASMQPLTVALRCLLRFLFVTGALGRDLSDAVPAIAHQASRLPKGIEESAVAALLESCDPSRSVGLRDRAVLMLLIRLGLRAGEVAGLGLEDVDWRAGELVVHGKGHRIDRLPLPADVGTTLVEYLRRGRPVSACRALFLRACAPYDAMTAGSVAMVPRTASARAGLPTIGAHQLRHTAATGMLSAGASLPAIAQVLRHRSEASTAIYAAVDRAGLEAVVRPWPGADR